MIPPSKPYPGGTLETAKFAQRQLPYYEGLEVIRSLGYDLEDLLHHFPAFVGHMTISRFLALYELYKQTLGVAGHVAEVGVYKGASLLWLAKLTQIFEPESLVQVHGFDWFRGMDTKDDDTTVEQGAYTESPERVRTLIRAQSLDDVVRLHEIDVTSELEGFLAEHPHLQFKFVFVDAGTYRVTRSALELLWPRITPGGTLVFDQYNHELSPGETQAVREILPDIEVRTLPWAWMPTAFAVKT
jgi:hypothetical protein